MVSAEDVAKAEWEMKVASAQVAIVDAEIAEIELRVQQLERRRTRIKQIIKLAERVAMTDSHGPESGQRAGQMPEPSWTRPFRERDRVCCSQAVTA